MLSNNLKESLLGCCLIMHKHMDELLSADFADSKLLEAMRYSALSDGKRIRPFLVMASAQIFGVPTTETLNTAAAIEFIHAYSLIHDDLPAMDDDDLRRGKLTCHKKFNEATAILAGDALLTYAFEILAEEKTHQNANVRCSLVKLFAKSSGYMGMAGGQMMDLENADNEISKAQLAKLHRMKTGELFMAAAESGAILAQATADETQSLRYFAHDLGLAFQIKDDILDHVGVNLGKIGIDEATHEKSKDNASIVDVVGIEMAQKQLEILRDQAIAHLKVFGDRASLLIDLTDFIIAREE